MYKGFFEDVEYVMGLFFKPFEAFCDEADDEDEDVSVSQQTEVTSANDQSGQDISGDEDEDETPTRRGGGSGAADEALFSMLKDLRKKMSKKL